MQIVVKNDGPKGYEAVVQVKEGGIAVFRDARVLKNDESAILYLRKGTTVLIEERRTALKDKV